MHKAERADEFVSLYLQCQRRVYGYVRSLVPQRSDAEDVFQEASRTMWEKFDQYESGTDFRAWAFRIVYFVAMRHHRSRRKAPQAFSDETLELIAEQAARTTAALEARHLALSDCLERLEKPDRELIEQRYRREATVKALAEAAGRSIDAVYRSLRRIHKQLFFCMQRKLAND